MPGAMDGRAALESTLQWLARTPGVLRAHVPGQSSETLDRRPSGKAWSQAEILAHLADYEVVCFQARVERIFRGEPIHARLLTEWVDHDLSHIRQLVTAAAQILQPDTQPESRAPGPIGTSGRASDGNSATGCTQRVPDNLEPLIAKSPARLIAFAPWPPARPGAPPAGFDCRLAPHPALVGGCCLCALARDHPPTRGWPGRRPWALVPQPFWLDTPEPPGLAFRELQVFAGARGAGDGPSGPHPQSKF